MSTALSFWTELATVTCYKCGVLFGMPSYMQQKRQEDGESFWCPNGHSQVYCESQVKKLEKQLAQEKERRYSRTV